LASLEFEIAPFLLIFFNENNNCGFAEPEKDNLFSLCGDAIFSEPSYCI
jgi:hypothetical protein